MTEQHPITPPAELVQQWYNECPEANEDSLPYIATQAARWGADQELLACGKYLARCAAWEEEDVTEMYNYRRSKPPSLKEQALEVLNEIESGKHGWLRIFDNLTTIRRALEQLND